MAQLVRDERIVLWDRRRQIVYDEPGVLTKWGVKPPSIPDWLALVGDSSDGYPGLPGWGAKSAAAVLRRYGHLEMIPRRGSEWDVPSLRGAVTLAATLSEQWDAAQLYRSLAILRTADDGVDIPQQQPDELRWDGAPKDALAGVLRRVGAAAPPRPPPPLARLGRHPLPRRRGSGRPARTRDLACLRVHDEDLVGILARRRRGGHLEDARSVR